MIQLDAFDANRLKTAREIVRGLGSVLVAYSGGVDSTLLLKLAMDELGEGAVEIRAAARTLGLANWNKPSFACLSSRIPHGTPVTVAALRQIEAAETALKSLGFRQVRVRHHGDVARIEVDGAEISRLIDERERVTAAVRKAGYQFVSADLEGYSTGSLNRTWRKGS